MTELSGLSAKDLAERAKEVLSHQTIQFLLNMCSNRGIGVEEEYKRRYDVKKRIQSIE